MDDEFPSKLVVACTGGIKGNMSKSEFTAVVKDAAACAVMQENTKHVIENIDNVMHASSDDEALNMKGALFVVDMIFYKAGERDTPGDCKLSTRLAHAMYPHAAGWLCRSFLRQTGADGLGRIKKIVARWHKSKWLSENDALNLVEVFQAMEKNREGAQALMNKFPVNHMKEIRHELANHHVSHMSVSSTCKPNDHMGGAVNSIVEPTKKRPRCSGIVHQSSVGTAEAEQKIQLPTVESPRKADDKMSHQNIHANQHTVSQTHAVVGNTLAGGIPRPDTWRVYGDCRCLFRAVCRALKDPLNKIARDGKGQPVEEKPRREELTRADDLRAQVCLEMRKHRDCVAKQIAGEVDVEEYLSRLEDWRTWGDAICVSFIADLVRRPIQVYALNINKNCVYESGLHLPKDESLHSEQVIMLWYNGKSHYDLVSTCWLRERELALYNTAKL